MTLWAIAYTLDNRGRPRKTPYVFSWTVSDRRRGAWVKWGGREAFPQQQKKWGAKAIKVRFEVVA